MPDKGHVLAFSNKFVLTQELIDVITGIKAKETLINSAVAIHIDSHILYNRSIRNTGCTGAVPYEPIIIQ